MLAVLGKVKYWAIGLLAALALIFRAKSKQYKAEAERNQERANSAEVVNKNKIYMDKAVNKTQQKHREEDRADNKTIAQGRRNHLDNDW